MSQGEKAAIVQKLRAEGYRLTYLLKAMELSRSTYYFEIGKKALVTLRNEMYYGCEDDFVSFDEISQAVKKYIDYYNNERIQEKTKWMSPVEYRKASMRSA